MIQIGNDHYAKIEYIINFIEFKLQKEQAIKFDINCFISKLLINTKF